MSIRELASASPIATRSVDTPWRNQLIVRHDQRMTDYDRSRELLARMNDYATTASWAVWHDDDITFPDNPVGLHGDVVLIAGNPGNAADDDGRTPWMNFHTGRRHNDHFLAAALRGTPLWGGYMTDLYSQVTPRPDDVDRSPAVTCHAANNLAKQLERLGARDPLLVLIGLHAFQLASEPYRSTIAAAVHVTPGELRWIHVPHYSRSNAATHRGRTEVYREAMRYAVERPRQKFDRNDFHTQLDG